MEVHERLAEFKESGHRFFLQILMIMIYINNCNFEKDAMSYLIEARVDAGKPRVRIVDELTGVCVVEWQYTEHADFKRLFQKLMLVSCLEESRCKAGRESMGMSGELTEGGRGGSYELKVASGRSVPRIISMSPESRRRTGSGTGGQVG